MLNCIQIACYRTLFLAFLNTMINYVLWYDCTAWYFTSIYVIEFIYSISSLKFQNGPCHKNAYDKNILKCNVLSMLNNKFFGWHKIYTDGSLSEHGRGAAFYDPLLNLKEKYKLLGPFSCIMSIELYAISEALSHIIGAGYKKAIILTDSRSALQHVARCASGRRGSAIAYNILSKVLTLVCEGVSLRMQWIPSHVGIHGNEVADVLAGEAISDGSEVFTIPEFSEVLFKYKKLIWSKWKEHFDVASLEKGIWYRTIQCEPPHVPWFADSKLKRKYIVIAHRLRSGHMPLNCFKYLMKLVDNPNCESCGVKEDVYHLLRECVRSESMREGIFRMFDVNQFDVGLFQSMLAVQTSNAANMLYRAVFDLVR